MQLIGNYAIYSYDEADFELVKSIENYLNNNAKTIFKLFGFVPQKKANIFIIPTKKEYDETLQKIRNNDSPIPEWNVGTTSYKGNIYYLSLRDYKNTTHKNILQDSLNVMSYYLKALFHEYIHFVTFEYCYLREFPIPCKCILEGIAQYYSEQKDISTLKFDYSLEDILYGSNCFDGWLLYVNYIVKHYNEDYLLGLLEEFGYATNEIERIYEDVKKYYNN